nr:hypothetical protein [Serratia proteamaculans]
MKKLFKLKEWLTIGETAKRLTTSFEEEINEADCLQLALDGHIIISALLSSSVYAIGAKKIKTTQRESLAPFIISTSEDGVKAGMLDGEKFIPNHQLDYEYEDIKRIGEVFSLRNGIYDLPMVGAEKLDVMHIFDLAQERAPREFVNIEGAFLNTEYGMVNVLASFNKLSFKTNGNGTMGLFDDTKEKFVDFDNYHEFFYPDDGLRDIDFIFRRVNIEQFERSVLENENPSLTMSESLLVIGSMLNALKNAQTSSKRWTQDAIKTEILENSQTIKSRTLDDYFSMANKCFKSDG